MSCPFARSRPSGARSAGLAALSLAAQLAAAPAGAQGSHPGYLLGAPDGSLSIRGGYDRALAASDLFSDVMSRLTLSKGDFSGFAVATDLGVRLSERFDVVVGSGFAGSSATSHYRKFTDADNKEIEQTTTFRRVPVSLSFKGYLAPRGRSIGRLAWIPTRVAPYLGAGGGVLYYQFRQSGDFIDFATDDLGVFTSTVESSKWTTEAHAFAGLDYTLNPNLALTGEARYTWGRATLNRADFEGYHPIDLSGVAVTAGLAVRF